MLSEFNWIAVWFHSLDVDPSRWIDPHDYVSAGKLEDAALWIFHTLSSRAASGAAADLIAKLVDRFHLTRVKCNGVAHRAVKTRWLPAFMVELYRWLKFVSRLDQPVSPHSASADGQARALRDP